MAWIVLVLYGMDLMEISIKDFSWFSLKKWLKKVANTPFKGLLSWLALGAILQSSAVTILIIMTFTSAWFISLASAIWAVVGANVWSTLLWILVVYVGFSFNIASLSLVFVAIWWLVYKFFSSNKRKNAWKMVFAFWLLFYGISILKDSVGVFSTGMDLTMFANIPLIGWFFIGIIFTAILQSSGAMSIITLWALHWWLLTFPQGMAIIAGANIGTCITPYIASLRGAHEKKQVAWSHIVYNVFASFLVMIFIQPLSTLIPKIYNFSEPGAQETALAMYQTFYNIFGAILFFPFIKPLSKFLEKIIPDKNLDYELWINKIGLTEVDIILPVIKNDILMLLKKIFKFNVHYLNIDQKALLNDDIWLNKKMDLEVILDQEVILEEYNTCKIIEEDILSYILKLLREESLNELKIKDLQNLYFSVERMMYSAKARKDTHHASGVLFNSDNEFIANRLKQLKKNMVGLYYGISEIIDKNDIQKNYFEVEKLTTIIMKDNKEFLQDVWKYLEKDELEEWLLSELLHFSQAYERSNDAIVDAIEIIFLQQTNGK